MLSLAQETWAWIEGLAADAPKPFVFGINGPQGAGKTTLARELERLATARGMRALALSVDDFYLTNAEQRALAAAHPHNRYWQQRGYPGTHDVKLGAETLRALRELPAGGAVLVPVYDKAADHGRGDRRPRAEWRKVVGPLDLLIFEGWMLGFPPVAALDDAALAQVNTRLADYRAWHESFDAFLQLRMAEPNFVLSWRVQSEASLRAEGRGGMSDAEAFAYAAQFLPAYEVFPAALAAQPPVPAERFRIRVLDLARRQCAAVSRL